MLLNKQVAGLERKNKPYLDMDLYNYCHGRS